MELEVGQVFRTKKGKKMEITEVYNGSVEVKIFVHRDSKNCKAYGWGHNTKWFKNCVILDGHFGFISTLEKEGWVLENRVSARVTK